MKLTLHITETILRILCGKRKAESLIPDPIKSNSLKVDFLDP